MRLVGPFSSSLIDPFMMHQWCYCLHDAMQGPLRCVGILDMFLLMGPV